MSTQAIVFLAVLSGSVVLLLWATRPPAASKKVSARLASIRTHTAVPEEDLTLSEVQLTGFAAKVSAKLKGYHFSESLELLLLHSGSKTTVGAVVLASIGLAGFLAVLAHCFSAPLPLEIVAALVGASSRYFVLKFQKGRRLKKFNHALADAIDLLSRALRAGHSIGSAIEILGEQTPEPLRGEFAICFRQQKFGIPFRDALIQMGSRVPSKDLHFLITAILVQKETGGDLTDILDRTTRVIRERVRIEGEVRTYTAQGRLTGWILSLLPIVMLTLINVITPGYSHILFHDPTGQMLLYAGGGLIAVGGFIISRIVDIKV